MTTPRPIDAPLGDEQIVTRVLAGETALFELLMRRYNRRVYRAVRAVLGDRPEIEDVMQDAYVLAYQRLDQLHDRAHFATWITRIAVREALARRRRAGRLELSDPPPEEGEEAMPLRSPGRTPEQLASSRELCGLLEHLIDALPQPFRTVFVLRALEEMSVTETAQCLDIPEETVKTRLHRARARLQRALLEQARDESAVVFGFHASRCDRVVAGVMRRIGGVDQGRREPF